MEQKNTTPSLQLLSPQELRSLRRAIKNIERAYMKAKETDNGWIELQKETFHLFKSLGDGEKELLTHKEGIVKRLNNLIDMYEEAREKSFAITLGNELHKELKG